MNYIDIRVIRIGGGRTAALKVDLIVRCVDCAYLVGALGYVHIARRSHFKVR